MDALIWTEERNDAIAVAAWELWTDNGHDMSADALVNSCKSTKDAVTNAYLPGMTDAEWLAATLKILRGN